MAAPPAEQEPSAVPTAGEVHSLGVSKKVKHAGSPVLVDNSALSWYTERAYLDDRYARWTARGNRDFLRVLARKATECRYFARGFPNSWNNASEEMWSTFHEGYSPQTWRGTTSSAMEGFQQLVPHQVPACVRATNERSRKLPSRGSARSVRSVRSGAAGSCGGGSTRTPSSRTCQSSRASCASSRITEGERAVVTDPQNLQGLPSRPSSGSSSNRLIRRLETLRYVSERPPAAGPVKKLDWDMFTVFGRRGFDNEPTGRRVIHPTYVPGPKLEDADKPEESDSD